jgi:hypothetical protein
MEGWPIAGTGLCNGEGGNQKHDYQNKADYSFLNHLRSNRELQ